MKKSLSLIRIIIAFFALSVLMPTNAGAQNFNLSKFTTVTGLPQNYVYSLVQDNNGFIWIAMAEGLSRYDGLKFTNYSTRDSLADNYVSRLLIDTDGRLWCGHGNGNFSVLENGRFNKIIVDGTSAPIKDMCLDDKGNIWAVEQNKGLIKISPDLQVTTFFDTEIFGDHLYYSIRAVNSLTMLVGTSEGLLVVKNEVDGTPKKPTSVPEMEYNIVNCIIEARDGRSYWIGLEEGDIYKYSVGATAEKVVLCEESCFASGQSLGAVRTIHEEEDGTLYVGTWGNGVMALKYDSKKGNYTSSLSINEENGLDNNFISDIMVDREGIYWFATYGAGVVAWINNFFAQYNMSDIGLVREKVYSVTPDSTHIWVGLNNGLVKMDKQCASNFEFYDTSMGLPDASAVTAVCFDEKTGTQYIGTDHSGIYYRLNGSHRFQPLEIEGATNTTKMINRMAIDSLFLYVATQGGFVTYDLNQRTSTIYTTTDGLPHNNINFVHIDSDGQVWIGPKDSGIALFIDGASFDVYRLSGVPVNVADMTFDEYNRIWLATANNGILCTTNDSIVSISTAEGLEKNYCFGIAADGNGHIWVCHQPGLSCVDLNTGHIRTFNSTNGIWQEFNGVTSDHSGDLWFASSSGVVQYMVKHDKRNNISPIINLTRVLISGKRHDLNKPIDLGYPYDGNADKFEFDFIGISMKDPKNVRYEYWLQKSAEDPERWTLLGTQTHKEFDFLPEGDYKLHIRAFNSDGMLSENPLVIPIHIDAPFWKSVWFYIGLFVIIIVLVRVFTTWREQKLRERQRRLEAEVARQTMMLSKQKAEIEKKNNDIMDSINYAKRIQTAILPTRGSLQNFPFTESFITFMPRDVVSGDFYWFNRYGNMVLICCGDCTGHGVPGAFMSMIGTTILNDATRDPEMRDPVKLLNTLDKEIKSTLNKNQTIETQDGMDCAIIAIDLETLEVRSAAARRPIYFFVKGRLNEVRGTRRSIGDHRNGNIFNETVQKLHKGDTIYMTSDGFTDQFGGEDGEKYTTAKFKHFLEDIQQDPFEDQQKKLEREFHKWKGEREQIDDVIIMAIKL